MIPAAPLHTKFHIIPMYTYNSIYTIMRSLFSEREFDSEPAVKASSAIGRVSIHCWEVERNEAHLPYKQRA